jgi:lipoprotein
MAAERNNNMKKILITMLCLLVFCFMLTGCTGGTTETTSTTDDKNSTTPQIPDTSDTSPIDSSDDIPGIDDSSSDIMTENPDGTTGAQPVTPSDSSFATTLPLFARLDFGTKTIAEDQKMTTHEYIVSAMTYNDEFLTVEFTEDSLKLTAKKDGTFKAAGDTAGVSDSQYFLRGTDTCYHGMNDFAISFDDLISYDFEEELRSGYGTWAGLPFTFDNVGQEDAWRGYHQYMKIRILNPTENDKIAVQFNNAQAYASTQFMVMSIGKQKNTYQTYIYDLCYAATYASGKGVLLPGQSPGNNWTWKQNTKVSGLKFHLLGATCSYANAYLNNTFDEGETAADYDVYAEYFNRLDSRALIKAGNSVEIDYIVFGSTPGQLKGYHSYIESSSMAES